MSILDFTHTLEMYAIVNITTKQSHKNVYTILLLLFCGPMWSGQWPDPGPGACGLEPGLSLKYGIVLWAGSGLDILVVGRARAS